jgi:hypothetical protein
MTQNPEFKDGLYVAISNDGAIHGQEMVKEFTEQRVCPVLYFEEDGVRIVPVFRRRDIALKFAKRNTPRKYVVGIMETSPNDRARLVADGFEVRELEWLNKRKCSVHVLFLDKEVETHNMGRLSDPFFHNGVFLT